MAQDLEKLILTLSADLKQYERAFAKAQGTTASAMRRIERDTQASATRVERTMGRLGGSIKGHAALIATGLVLAFGAMAKSAITDAAAVGDLADKLGVTSDKIQELQFGAVQANLSFEELTTGLLKFSKAIGQAQNGQGDLQKTLEVNGFDKARIQAMTYSEALDAVADLVKNAKDEQDAFLIITQAFGRGSDEFLEFLRNGSEGLKTFAKQAHEATMVIDETLIKAGQRFDDAWALAILHIKKMIGDLTLSSIVPLFQIMSDMKKMAGGGGGPWVTTDSNGIIRQTDSLKELLGTAQKVNREAMGDLSVVGKKTKINDPNEEATRKAAADQFVRDQKAKADAIKAVSLALDHELSLLGKSDRQKAIDNELNRAGTTIATEEGKAIAAKAAAIYDYNAALEAAELATEHFIELQKISRQQLEEMASVFQNEFSNALLSVVDGTESVKDAFKNMATSILQTITQLLLDRSLAMLATMLLNGGNIAPSQSSGIASLFGRASGGHVNAGQPYIVGENRRAEVFVPSQSGNISPRMAGGSSGLTIIDQRSNAPPVEAKRQPNGNWTAMIRDEINKTLGTGAADATMGSRYGMSPRGTRR